MLEEMWRKSNPVRRKVTPKVTEFITSSSLGHDVLNIFILIQLINNKNMKHAVSQAFQH